MRKIIIISSIISLTCCKTSKDLKIDDKTESNTKKEIVERKRPGSKTILEIPHFVYKDTTITNINYVDKTILTAKYDRNGNKTIECMSQEINERIEKMEASVKNDIETRNKIEREFNPQYFIYALGFLGLIMIVLILFVQKSITTIQKNIPEIVKGIFSELNK